MLLSSTDAITTPSNSNALSSLSLSTRGEVLFWSLEARNVEEGLEAKLTFDLDVKLLTIPLLMQYQPLLQDCRY